MVDPRVIESVRVVVVDQQDPDVLFSTSRGGEEKHTYAPGIASQLQVEALARAPGVDGTSNLICAKVVLVSLAGGIVDYRDLRVIVYLHQLLNRRRRDIRHLCPEAQDHRIEAAQEACGRWMVSHSNPETDIIVPVSLLYLLLVLLPSDDNDSVSSSLSSSASLQVSSTVNFASFLARDVPSPSWLRDLLSQKIYWCL